MSRLRSFTLEEVKYLESLIEPIKNIIDATRTDVEMAAKKKQCWLEIENKFNSSTNLPRTVAMLKKKYENLKRIKGLTSKRKRASSKVPGRKTNDSNENTAKASVNIETPTDVQTSSSSFADDSEGDYTIVSPSKVIKEEINDESTTIDIEELLLETKPTIEDSIIPINYEPISTSIEPTTSQLDSHPIYNENAFNEEMMKLLREKRNMETELLKKEANAKLHCLNMETILLKIKIDEYRLKQDIVEMQKEQIMKNLK
ncbi:uncharacterized protein LOC143192634 [Rhynchophorus ferrugineus]|uniref:uncharacterized protein LOC143192634 n=1 Tax=Rhynchophorus ferrugineus TaxID=354439 RepID=UPI003FCC7B0D